MEYEDPGVPADAAGSAPTNEALVDTFVKLRDEVDTIKARHQQELAHHNMLMERITSELDTRMASSGTKSIGTDAGTAMRMITDTPVCGDWSAFEKWFWEERRLDLFPRKLNAAPFKEMLEAGRDLPPGVRLERSARVQIRRKNAR